MKNEVLSIDNLLKNRIININKLLDFGFKKINDKYVYEDILIKDKFMIIVTYENELDAKVIDLVTNEEYIPVKVSSMSGEFVGKVREKYSEKLKDIIKTCFDKEVFKNKQTKDVIHYIKSKYNNEPEFLWEKYDSNAVFRHDNTKKWYGLLMTISKDKLNLKSNEIVDVLNVKLLPEEIIKLVDNKQYFLGYHMNKKHWITIVLNGKIPNEKVFELIDKSYNI